MTKKMLVSVLVFTVFFSAAAFTQNNKQAEKLLDDLLLQLKETAIQTDFKLSAYEVSSKTPHVMEGSITIKGDKFVMRMDGLDVFFDGKTQWIYSEDIEEISIAEPMGEELNQTNPILILSDFRTKSIVRFAPKQQTSTIYDIEMAPVSLKDSEIAKISLRLNKSDNAIVSIEQTNVDGFKMVLEMTSFKKNIVVNDSFFKLDRSNYPDADINDLR